MWSFIKQIIQLLLSPSRGWEDISEAVEDPDVILKRGYLPWLGVAAASSFLTLIYKSHATVLGCLENAIAIGGALFASVYIARLFLDLTLAKNLGAEFNPSKISKFVTYLMGLNCLYRVIENLLPASMTFLLFLPLLSLLVIFKAMKYLGVGEDNAMSFVCLSAVAVIVVPIALCALLLFLI